MRDETPHADQPSAMTRPNTFDDPDYTPEEPEPLATDQQLARAAVWLLGVADGDPVLADRSHLDPVELARGVVGVVGLLLPKTAIIEWTTWLGGVGRDAAAGVLTVAYLAYARDQPLELVLDLSESFLAHVEELVREDRILDRSLDALWHLRATVSERLRPPSDRVWSPMTDPDTKP